ncbi:hypothetical protein [Alteromonas sp. AMM-1]|uniref:hypothetical protein n=1 Tax=Alteromonas sp. AMM-1 TaxID=3394233 RepID=UPI0039A46A3D
MNRSFQLLQYALVGISALALCFALFCWNEARKEVVYLCGNFTSGVTHKSVMKQLATANYLDVTLTNTEYGARIISDSAVSLRMYRCNIDLDTDGEVITASVSGWF